MVICRICLSKNIRKDINSLPSDLEVNSTIEEIMWFCLSIELQDKKAMACTNCYESIISYYKFKVLAIESDKYLKAKKEESNKIKVKLELPLNSDVDDVKEVKTEVEELEENSASEGLFHDDLDAVQDHDSDAIEDTKVPTKTPCKVCGKRVKYLSIHMKRHPPDSRLKCRECGKICKSQKAKKIHFKAYHGPNKVTCEICNKVVASLTQHNNYHHIEHKRVIPCPHCPLKLSSQLALECHLSKHLKKREYVCDYCMKDYFWKVSLERHIRQVHMKESMFTCDDCGKSFLKKGLLKRHLLQAHNSLNTALPKKGTACHECGKIVTDLTEHMQTHLPATKRTRHQCSTCSKSYLYRTDLQRHIRNIHLAMKTKCEVCHKEVFGIKTHMQRNHAPKRFICQQCGYRTASQSLLRQHQVSHRKDCPHHCDTCGKDFKTQPALNAHIRYVHERPARFLCNFCAKPFVTKKKLEDHLPKHSDNRPYPCKLCDLKFKMPVALKRHLSRVHHGIRSHVCPVCGMAFVTRDYLTAHMVTHTKVKRYPCRYCEVRFGRGDHRRRHERTLHGADAINSTTDIFNK